MARSRHAAVRQRRWALAPVAVLARSGLVWQTSNAAFTATTSNPSNTWSTGSVRLSDDDGGATPTTGSAMFSVANLKPGDTGERCIVVTSHSSLATGVRLYGSGVSSTNALGDHLDLVVQSGSGGSFGGGCGGFTSSTTEFTGTLTGFGLRAGYATGIGSWSTTAPGQTRTYRIAYTLSSSTPNTAQSSSAQATFVWEAQTA